MDQSTQITEVTLAQLSKKIDDQSRFTRSVLIMCTLSILALVCYTLTEMSSILPHLILMELQGNLEKIVVEWREAEKNLSVRQTKPAPATETP